MHSIRQTVSYVGKGKRLEAENMRDVFAHRCNLRILVILYWDKICTVAQEDNEEMNKILDNFNGLGIFETMVLGIVFARHPAQQSETVDHLVIFSGDGDFTTLVEALQRRGRKVSVVSTMSTQPPMIADDLRRQADHFIDLLSLKGEIGRDPSERAARHVEPVHHDDDN